MTISDKDALVRKAVEDHFSSFAYVETDEVKIKLGAAFEAAVWEFLQKKRALREKFEAYFRGLSDQEIEYFASYESHERGAQIPEELASLREESRNNIGGKREYLLIAVGFYPEYLPDYKMWELRDIFDEFELNWLSIGFDPLHPLIQSQRNSIKANKAKLDPLVKHLSEARSEIIRRSKTLATFGHNAASGRKALDWLNSIELEVPKGFREMLEISAARVEGGSPVGIAVGSPKEERPDPRAIRSASRIIAAMAMDFYGWRPDDSRSPIAGEIETICDTKGLSVTRETILKYLRMGAEQIDANSEEDN